MVHSLHQRLKRHPFLSQEKRGMFLKLSFFTLNLLYYSPKESAIDELNLKSASVGAVKDKEMIFIHPLNTDRIYYFKPEDKKTVSNFKFHLYLFSFCCDIETQ